MSHAPWHLCATLLATFVVARAWRSAARMPLLITVSRHGHSPSRQRLPWRPEPLLSALFPGPVRCAVPTPSHLRIWTLRALLVLVAVMLLPPRLFSCCPPSHPAGLWRRRVAFLRSALWVPLSFAPGPLPPPAWFYARGCRRVVPMTDRVLAVMRRASHVVPLPKLPVYPLVMAPLPFAPFLRRAALTNCPPSRSLQFDDVPASTLSFGRIHAFRSALAVASRY